MNPIYRFVNFLAPDNCLGCGAEGKLLCEACSESLIAEYPSSCLRCGKITKNFATCATCRRASGLAAVVVVTRFEGIGRELLHETKFSQRRGGTEVMSKLLSEKLVAGDFDLITHCPTTSQRVRERGFDQSKLIAKQMSRQLKLPYASVVQRRSKLHQVGQNKAERLRHAEKAYQVMQVSLVSGRRILLIDDVYTTGATLQAIAKQLKNAGAKSVVGAVFAH